MTYSKTQMIAAAAIPVGALAVHYGAPYVFTAAANHITVVAGTKAATALYIASGAVAAVGAIAATAAVGWAAWKAVKWIRNRFPRAGKVMGSVVSAAVAVGEVVANAVGKAANGIPDTPEVSGVFNTPTPEAVKAYAGETTTTATNAAYKAETKSAQEFKNNAPKASVADHFTDGARISDIPKTAIAAAMEAAGLSAAGAH